MNHQIVFGNRLLIRRVDLTPAPTPDKPTIFISDEVADAMKKKLDYYTCEVVQVGTGKAMSEIFHQIGVGKQLVCDNRMGSVKLPDGLEIISVDDVLTVIGAIPDYALVAVETRGVLVVDPVSGKMGVKEVPK